MDSRSILLVATLVAGSLAGPISKKVDLLGSSKCASECRGINNKFQYEAGRGYQYRYSADTVTTIQGASEEHSSLHISATATIDVLEPCEMSLKLTDVTLEESNPKDLNRRSRSSSMAEFKRKLEELPLRFAFQDGHIESVCPSIGEEPWVQNIKHGILSVFQNTMDDFDHETVDTDEIDVSGNCPTTYKIIESQWDTKVINRSKDILGCLDRNHHQTYMQGTPYDSSSPLQSVPILKSSHECQQRIDADGKLIQTACEEIHIFRPFSKQTNGAMTKSNQMLEFVRVTRGSRVGDSDMAKQMDLKFIHYEKKEDEFTNLREAENIVRNLCELSTDDIRPEVPALFSRLIYKLRELDYDSLSTIMTRSQLENPCEKAKKFMVDAVPLLGTTASIKLVKDKIAGDDLKDYDKTVWLTAISMIPKPNLNMLKEIKDLLDLPEPSHKVMLAISTLTYSYCQTNPECDKQADVKYIIKKFESQLGYNCKVTPETEDTVIMALKSIGNIGITMNSAATLNRCILNDGLPISVRVAAMESFRRISCDQNEIRFDNLMTMFKDADLDSEVRIGAYLMLMKCPTSARIIEIKDTLEKEEVNQVGSFVWTHLTNLMETSAPHKQDIRSIVESEYLQKAFNMDKRKFSRNIEWSLFSDMLNIGANVESNLIWSQKSFIPRSAMLNLTFDMFGQSVNLFEVGGRVEGLEHWLEQMFGPEGYFTNNIPQFPKRSKRAAMRPQKLQRLEDRYDYQAPEAKASMYMKLFGNEIRYMALDNKGSDKEKFNYLNYLIDLANENTVDFTKSVMFLDSSFCFPTVTGLPLKLSINGTATVDLKVGGKLDVRKLFTSPRSVDIDGFIKPSGAVEISSMMGIDAFVTELGVKMVSTLHTSTYAEGKIELKNGEILNLKVDMPKDKIEILDVKTKFYIVHGGEDREQKMITSNRVDKEGCLGSALVKTLGIELCGALSYPNASLVDEAPYFPLTGPTSMSLVLNKRDTHTAYEFEAALQLVKKVKEEGVTKHNTVARVKFDTPGSQEDRHLSMDLLLKHEDKAFSMAMKSPWKTLDANGEVVVKPDLHRLSMTAMVDESKRYALTYEMQMTEKGATITYTPSFELQMPNKPAVTLKGEIEKTVKAKLGVYEYKGELDVQSPYASGKMYANIGHDRRKGLRSNDIKFEYEDKRGNKQHMRYTGKVKYISNAKITKYTLTGINDWTQYPEYNIDYTLAGALSSTSLTTDAEIKYGARKKKIMHSSEFTRHPTDILQQFNGQVSLKCAAKGIDAKLEIDHKKQGTKYLSKLDAQLNPKKKLGLESEVELNLKGKKKKVPTATLR